jgi:hypothetical protein
LDLKRRKIEKDHKIGYAFLGIDKTQPDDFLNMKRNELGRM